MPPATCTLTERLDAEALEVVVNHFDELYQHLGTFRDARNGYSDMSQEQAKAYAQGLLDDHLQSDQVTYAHAKRMTEGRLFAKRKSLQGAERRLRHTVAARLYDDVDIENCHPVILEHLLKQHDIPCDALSDYIANRDARLADLQHVLQVPRDAAKRLMLKALNKHDLANTVKDAPAWYLAFVQQAYTAREALVKHYPKYLARAKKKLGAHGYNVIGSAVNQVLCVVENDVLETMVARTRDLGYEVGVLCFDGMMVYKDQGRDNDAYLRELEKAVQDKHNLAIRLTVKEMTQGIPADVLEACRAKGPTAPGGAQSTLPARGLEVDVHAVKAFCDLHARNPGSRRPQLPPRAAAEVVAYLNAFWGFVPATKPVYVDERFEMTARGERRRAAVVMRGESNFQAAYRSIGAAVDAFIESADKRTHRAIGVDFSTEESTPELFNMYAGFAVRPRDCPDALEMSDEDLEAAVAPYLEHVRDIWCQGDEELAEWCFNFHAWILQRPAQKAGASLTLQSDQGAGKDCINTDIIGAIVGPDCFLDVHDIGEFTGRFTSQLEGKRLCILNEVQFAGDVKVANNLKTKITAPMIKIERKGFEPYQVQNCIETIAHTNGAHSSHVELTDRRNQIIKLDNRYAGPATKESRQYFARLRAVPIELVATWLYRRDLADVNLRQLVRTAAMDAQKLQSMGSVEQFIHATLSGPACDYPCRQTKRAMHELYCSFHAEHCSQYDKRQGSITFIAQLRGLVALQEKTVKGTRLLEWPSQEAAIAAWNARTGMTIAPPPPEDDLPEYAE